MSQNLQQGREQMLSIYRKRLHLQDAIFLPIEHPDAMVALVYKVERPHHSPLILKICSRSADFLREVYYLQYFAEILPVPRLHDVVKPEEGLHGAILMECLRGALIQPADSTDRLAYEMGVILASIHLHRVAGFGDLTRPQELISDPSIPFTAKFEEGVEECREHLPERLLEQYRRYYENNVSLFSSVDGPCIIHRDFRAGNALIHEGKIQGIIDWSAARAGFAEDDFCTLEHGEWAFDTNRKRVFLAGYASIRPVPDYSASMPFLRFCRAIGAVGFTVKSATWQGPHAAFYQKNRLFLDSFF